MVVSTCRRSSRRPEAGGAAISKENHPLFLSERVSDRVVRIIDVSGTMQYLVIGSEKAALVDTGYGCGDIKAYAQGFTDKPIIVVITHGHRDHAMGCMPFGSAYISPLDLDKYREDSDLELRKAGVAKSAMRPGNTGLHKYVEDGDWFEALPPSMLKPLYQDDVFDLGDRSIEVLEAPGHSPGSVMLLLPEDRILIAGDACNCNTRIWTSVAEYRASLAKAKAAADGRYDRVLYSHETGEGPIDTISGVIGVCDEILAGTDDRIPFVGNNIAVFQGRRMLLAKAKDEAKGPYARVDGGVGNLVYDADLVR